MQKLENGAGNAALIFGLLFLAGCVPQPQYSPSVVYGPGYAPAYPCYELHDGEISACQKGTN